MLKKILCDAKSRHARLHINVKRKRLGMHGAVRKDPSLVDILLRLLSFDREWRPFYQSAVFDLFHRWRGSFETPGIWSVLETALRRASRIAALLKRYAGLCFLPFRNWPYLLSSFFCYFPLQVLNLLPFSSCCLYPTQQSYAALYQESWSCKFHSTLMQLRRFRCHWTWLPTIDENSDDTPRSIRWSYDAQYIVHKVKKIDRTLSILSKYSLYSFACFFCFYFRCLASCRCWFSFFWRAIWTLYTKDISPASSTWCLNISLQNYFLDLWIIISRSLITDYAVDAMRNVKQYS